MSQMKKMGGMSKYPEHDAAVWAQRKMLDIDDADEKQMARMEAIILFHDAGGACESRPHESVPQAPNCERAQAWILQRSTVW